MADAPTLPAAPAKPVRVFLVGNPNTGKTTLFNALTGLRHRVGNYPGVTVETKTGMAKVDGATLSITDVPGTYSLSARSPDEMLTVDLLLGHRPEEPRPDVVVCILDASNLERNLYLASQVLELGVPTVLALNMIDVADAQGVRLDIGKLERQLGVPVVPVQANAKRGIGDLTRRIVESAGGSSPCEEPAFPEAFETEVDGLGRWLADHGAGSTERFLLERALFDAGGQTETVLCERHGPELSERLATARERLGAADCPVPATEARARYRWIAERLAGAVRRPTVRKITFSDRIDRVLMHRVWGLVVFLSVMAIMFQAIYSWAGPFMDTIDAGFGSLGVWIGGHLPEGALRGLVVDGVIAGVGGVLIFLPQIMILFGFIAVLEDCGYMARAAFLMDKVMARAGLSGKSFIPMLSSFACAIPGVMAARTIEDRRDRLTTILVAPLMSCSARLPVYFILATAFVPATTVFGFFDLPGIVIFSMYLIGLIVAPLVAWTLKKTLIGGETPVFLMELPSYKLPSVWTVLYRMCERGWAFVRRAGTIILATTVVIWALQYYPRPPEVAERFALELATLEQRKQQAGADVAAVEEQISEIDNRIATEYQAQSVLGLMGKAIEPVVVPLGWDWRIGMAAIASFPAREVVIGALGTIYSVGEADEESVSLRDAMKRATWPDGRPVFNVPVALSLMVFFALCCQCAATLAVIKRETNSWRWPLFTFVYMTVLAYLAALVVYQVGIRIG